MKRATTNMMVDGVAYLAFLGLSATGLLIRWVLPPGSGMQRTVWGMTRHEWGDLHFYLVIAFAVLLIVHLVLHWSWVCVTLAKWTARGPTRFRRQNAFGLTLAAGTIVSLVVFLLSARASIIERPTGADGRGEHALYSVSRPETVGSVGQRNGRHRPGRGRGSAPRAGGRSNVR